MVSRSTQDGRFVRTKSELDRYWSKVDVSGGEHACWPWTGGTFTSGYGRLSLADAKRSSVRSHRWGYQTLIDAIPPGEIVRHTCDNLICHNPTHWVLGTNAMNSADMVERGRSHKGVTNHQSKLSEADVREIKRLLPFTRRGKGRPKQGQLTQRAIAAQFGVSAAVINQIRAGRVWSHVT